MKTLWRLSALAVLGLTVPVWAQELKDPGFETPGPTLVSASDAPSGKAQINGVVADGWQDNTNWADVKIVYSLDPQNSHGGRFSQQIAVQRGFAQFVQPIAFQKGRYRATVWMRAQPAQWVSPGLRQAGAPYAVYGGTPVKVGPRWTKVDVEGVTPVVAGGLYVNMSGTGTLWLDDARLTFLGDTPPPAQALSPPQKAVPRVFFGLNVNHLHDPPGFDWPALDFGTFRTWDSGDIWPNIEPARGVYHWDLLDKDVAEAQTHHTQFLFTLGQTPAWASSRPTEPAVYGPGLAAPPADRTDWRDFVRAVATRYKGRIAAYEVWNEPDQKSFYTGTPAQLAALERETAEVVHQTDPHALVLSAPVAGGNGVAQLQFLDDYLSAGEGKYADVIAYHDYNYPAESNIAALRLFRARLAAHGLSRKPVWDTETGTDLSTTMDADTAAYVSRALALDWALGLDRVCLYAYDGSFTGLDRPLGDGKKRDPATLALSGLAYRQAETWLTGARMLSCASDAHATWTCALQHPDGSRAWIVWNTQGPQTFSVPSAWKATSVQDLAGAITPVSRDTTTIGVAPVLLK